MDDGACENELHFEYIGYNLEQGLNINVDIVVLNTFIFVLFLLALCFP